MSSVLCFSRDPGAANCVVPVSKRLKEIGHTVDLYGKDFAAVVYERAGVSYTMLSSGITDEDLEKMVRSYDVVVTGTTSVGDDTDRRLWKVCRTIDVPTVSVLDQWMNYIDRFTYKDEHIFPDLICVPDVYAQAEMVKEGIPEQIIVPTGQPYLEKTAKDMQSVSEDSKKGLLQELGVSSNTKIVTFASEPITADHGKENKLGYTEISILGHILDVLQQQDKTPISFIVKLHPRNTPEEIMALLEARTLPPNVQVVVNQSADSHTLIAISDLVIGMSSMFLLEAYVAHTPIVSVQIGLTDTDPFILGRTGVVDTIIDTDTLAEQFVRLLSGKKIMSSSCHIPHNATTTITEIITKQIHE